MADQKCKNIKCKNVKCKTHAENLVSLISHDTEFITLIIGPAKTKISCHKILLSYYSDFFDRMLNGGFEEAGKPEVELPEDDAELISNFVKWLYVGNMDECVDIDPTYGIAEANVFIGAQLWVLGDKLLAPKFFNDAMSLTLAHYSSIYLQTGTTEYIYSNTYDTISKLRALVRDLIAYEGPFSEDLEDNFDPEAWTLLLAKGGDIVRECIAGGFHNAERWRHLGRTSEDHDIIPAPYERAKNYDKACDRPSVEDWLVSRSKV